MAVQKHTESMLFEQGFDFPPFWNGLLYGRKQCPHAFSQIHQGEVRIVPRSPTVTNREPDQATPKSFCEVPEAWAVQVLPSGEVRIVPLTN